MAAIDLANSRVGKTTSFAKFTKANITVEEFNLCNSFLGLRLQYSGETVNLRKRGLVKAIHEVNSLTLLHEFCK